MAPTRLHLVLLVLVVGGVSGSPLPQLIVKSQSNLWREQPGRQIDLSKVLPTQELFWLNLEEVRGSCNSVKITVYWFCC